VNTPSPGPAHPAPPLAGRYPSDLEHRWEPAGGPSLLIRPLRPDDIEREMRFVAALSPETRYLRLQYAASSASAKDLERLLDVDYVGQLALAAITDDEIVGVSRYARIAGTSNAECAIVVADAWQGRGLGSELMRSLVLAAQARGIECLVGETLAENQRIAEWARRLGFNVCTEPHTGGHLKVSVALDFMPPQDTGP
jgi:acetyltransferase